MDESTAVLLMAHGSRRQSANDDLVQLARMLRDRGSYPIVEIGYLELAEPTIPDGGRRCARAGATRVKMMPYFLSAGTHVVNDLREFREELEAEFPGVKFELCPHLGLHPLMLDIVQDRLNGVADGIAPAEETVKSV